MDVRPTASQATIIASFVIAGLGSAFLFLLPAPQRHPAIADDPESVELAAAQDAVRGCDSDDAKSGLECRKKHLKEWVQKESPESAFRRLRLLYPTDTQTKAHCHQLAHEIGHAGFDKYRDVAIAFTHGDSFCWSGYYHGVLESYVADVGYARLPERLNGICEAMPGREQYSFDYYNCVHGIGHGVMAITGDDLRSSLQLCEKLDGRWEQQSCYGGAFMQNNINEFFGEHRSDFKADDPAYPCSEVDVPYKDSCYISQTSHMLLALGGDFSKVFAACEAIPDREFLDTCYQSLGRDASGSTVSDPERTKAICMLGTDGPQRVGCVIGAAKDFIYYFHSDKQAMAFCGVLGDDSLEKTCYATVDQFGASFR